MDGLGDRNMKPTEFGYVTLFVLTVLEVHCKCVSRIKFRTLGASISSNIFSVLFILSSPEISIECILDLSIVLHVSEALLFFPLDIFSLSGLQILL